jgi:hypothetical protein
LAAHGQHRIEIGHRVLGNQRDLVPARTAHRALADLGEIPALETDLAFDEAGGRHRQQPQQTPYRHRPAAAGLADDAQCLAMVQREGNAVEHLKTAVEGLDVQAQGIELQEGGLAAHRPRLLGSKTSREPSPSRLNPSTVR